MHNNQYKGVLRYGSKWTVVFNQVKESLPLHPDDVKTINELYAKHSDTIANIYTNPDVEFYIVSALHTTISTEDMGDVETKLVHYAKLTNPITQESLRKKVKQWDEEELLEILDSYRLYCYGNGLSAEKLVHFFEEYTED